MTESTQIITPVYDKFHFLDKQVYATQLSAVAMKDMESDTVFIEASASSGIDVYRQSGEDWSSVYFSQQTFTEMQGIILLWCMVSLVKIIMGTIQP